jgi:hypothetical protein
MLTLYKHGDGQLTRKLHHRVTETGLGKFWVDYLMRLNMERTWEKLEINYNGLGIYPISHIEDGSIEAAHQEKITLQLGAEKYAKESGYFNKTLSGAYTAHPKAIEDNLLAITQMVELCKSNHITCWFFITPEHHYQVKALPLKDYFYFLEKLASITPYWNFSGPNSITNNDDYYYEPGHYRPIVSDLIAKRIFSADGVPKDFGTYVSERNWSQYRSRLIEHLAFNGKNYPK